MTFLSAPPPPRRDRRLAAVVVVAAALVLAVFLLLWRAKPVSPAAPPAAAPAETRERTPPPPKPPRVRTVTPETPTPQEPGAAPEQPASAELAAKTPPTGLSVEVVDETGALVREGTVKIEIGNLLQFSSMDGKAIAQFMVRVGKERSLAEANPVVLADLATELDGLDVKASARTRDAPPTAAVKGTIHLGSVETLHLVLAHPRSVQVLVTDRATEAPVASASVVSVTELRRRDADPAAARGTIAPGATVTDRGGRCVLTGLGPGEHEIAVEAAGYAREETKWTEGDLRVRLEPQPAGGTITVRVFGFDGSPVAGIGVKHLQGDRDVKTDATGSAVFENVAPGDAILLLDVIAWTELCDTQKWDTRADTPLASATVEAGGTYDLQLGFPRGTASIDVRIVGEDGAPLPDVKATLGGPRHARAESDDAGTSHFSGLPAGTYYGTVDVGPHAGWWFGDIELAEGGHAAATWKLGRNTIRGRVVVAGSRGKDEEIQVGFKGPAEGLATAEPDGHFELRRAVAGVYHAEAHSIRFGSRAKDVTIPSDGEIVLEMVEYGRVAVRFASADKDRLQKAKIVVIVPGLEDDAASPRDAGDNDRIASRVLPGRCEVEVRLDGRTRRYPVDVTSGKTTVVEVRAP